MAVTRRRRSVEAEEAEEVEAVTTRKRVARAKKAPKSPPVSPKALPSPDREQAGARAGKGVDGRKMSFSFSFARQGSGAFFSSSALAIIVAALVALFVSTSKLPSLIKNLPDDVQDFNALQQKVHSLEASVKNAELTLSERVSLIEFDSLQAQHRGVTDRLVAHEEMAKREVERLEQVIRKLEASLLKQVDTQVEKWTAEDQASKAELKKAMDRLAADEVETREELKIMRAEPMDYGQLRVEIENALADRTGDADFALHGTGARVMSHSHLHPRKGDPWLFPNREGDWYAFSMPYDTKLPKFVRGLAKRVFPTHPRASDWLLSLPPAGFETPGHCLPLKGSKGFVDIELKSPTWIDAVSLEHLPARLAYNMTTAPREVKVSSWPPSVEIASFSYDTFGKPSQKFRVKPDSVVKPATQVRLEVLSNHGSREYTCLYRFKVHGREAS